MASRGRDSTANRWRGIAEDALVDPRTESMLRLGCAAALGYSLILYAPDPAFGFSYSTTTSFLINITAVAYSFGACVLLIQLLLLGLSIGAAFTAIALYPLQQSVALGYVVFCILGSLLVIPLTLSGEPAANTFVLVISLVLEMTYVPTIALRNAISASSIFSDVLKPLLLSVVLFAMLAMGLLSVLPPWHTAKEQTHYLAGSSLRLLSSACSSGSKAMKGDRSAAKAAALELIKAAAPISKGLDLFSVFAAFEPTLMNPLCVSDLKAWKSFIGAWKDASLRVFLSLNSFFVSDFDGEAATSHPTEFIQVAAECFSRMGGVCFAGAEEVQTLRFAGAAGDFPSLSRRGWLWGHPGVRFRGNSEAQAELEASMALLTAAADHMSENAENRLQQWAGSSVTSKWEVAKTNYILRACSSSIQLLAKEANKLRMKASLRSLLTVAFMVGGGATAFLAVKLWVNGMEKLKRWDFGDTQVRVALQWAIGTWALYAMASFWPFYSDQFTPQAPPWTLMAFYVVGCTARSADLVISNGITRILGSILGGLLAWAVLRHISSKGSLLFVHILVTMATTWLSPAESGVSSKFSSVWLAAVVPLVQSIRLTYTIIATAVFADDDSVKDSVMARIVSQAFGSAAAAALSLMILPVWSHPTAQRARDRLLTAICKILESMSPPSGEEQLLVGKSDPNCSNELVCAIADAKSAGHELNLVNSSRIVLLRHSANNRISDNLARALEYTIGAGCAASHFEEHLCFSRRYGAESDPIRRLVRHIERAAYYLSAAIAARERCSSGTSDEVTKNVEAVRSELCVARELVCELIEVKVKEGRDGMMDPDLLGSLVQAISFLDILAQIGAIGEGGGASHDEEI